MGSTISATNNTILNRENTILQNSQSAIVPIATLPKDDLTVTFNNHTVGKFPIKEKSTVDFSNVLSSQYDNEIDTLLAGVAASEQSTENAWPMSIQISPGTTPANTKEATRNYIANILQTTCQADAQTLETVPGQAGTTTRDVIILDQNNDARLNCTLNNLSRMVEFNTVTATHQQENRKGNIFLFLLIVLVIFILIMALIAIFIIGFHTTSSTVEGASTKQEAIEAAEFARQREDELLELKQEQILAGEGGRERMEAAPPVGAEAAPQEGGLGQLAMMMALQQRRPEGVGEKPGAAEGGEVAEGGELEAGAAEGGELGGGVAEAAEGEGGGLFGELEKALPEAGEAAEFAI